MIRIMQMGRPVAKMTVLYNTWFILFWQVRQHWERWTACGWGANLAPSLQQTSWWVSPLEPTFLLTIIFFLLHRQVSPRQTSALDTDMPIPPYMPMQSSTSKKSASLERKIKKKKEKEGCKQQWQISVLSIINWISVTDLTITIFSAQKCFQRKNRTFHAREGF